MDLNDSQHEPYDPGDNNSQNAHEVITIPAGTSSVVIRERWDAIIMRPAKPSDVGQLVDLAIDALRRNPVKGLRISKDRMLELAIECISGPSHFCWVVEVDGKLRGAVTAYVHDMMFYERKQCTILQYYCTMPGYGIKLLEEFFNWAQTRPAIKLIEVVLEDEHQAGIKRIFQRFGMKESLPVMIKAK